MLSHNSRTKLLSESRRNLLFALCLGRVENHANADDQAGDQNKYLFLPNNIHPQNYSLPRCPSDNFEESSFVFEYKSLRNNLNIGQIKFENNNFILGFIKIIKLSEINDAKEILNIYKLNQDVSQIVLNFKSKYNRTRPHIYMPSIDPVVAVPDNSSYPGGHSTQSYLTALYLAKKYPSYSQQLFQYAYQIGFNREIAGLHYPTDTAAGYLLAKKIFADLDNNLQEV